MDKSEELRAMLYRVADVIVETLVAREQPAGVSSKNMRIRDFAEHTGLGESTLRKYLSEGMPANRLGPRRITIPVAEAEEWLRARGKGRAA